MSSHSGSTESWVGMARAQFHDFMGLLDQFFFTPSVPYTLAAIRIMGGLTVLYINFCFTWKCLDRKLPNTRRCPSVGLPTLMIRLLSTVACTLFRYFTMSPTCSAFGWCMGPFCWLLSC